MSDFNIKAIEQAVLQKRLRGRVNDMVARLETRLASRNAETKIALHSQVNSFLITVSSFKHSSGETLGDGSDQDLFEPVLLEGEHS